MSADFSSGLSLTRENHFSAPLDIPSWCENMLFTIHDPKTNISLWLHLGTVPNDWTMWHEYCYATLPNGDVMSMWSFHRTAADRRPAGANLDFKCITPFQHWKIVFDGFGLITPRQEMLEGITREGIKQRFYVELDVRYVAPAWDMHAAQASGHGSMESQEWAKEHYEQLHHSVGKVILSDTEYEFDGYGWRDHSSGPRGGGVGGAWGGHVIAGCHYPSSGRSWGLCSYWTPDGSISLEGAYVTDSHGNMTTAEITERPRLRDLIDGAEEIPVGLKWDGGELKTHITAKTHLWTAMQKQLVVGKDLSGPGLMYVLNHGPALWDSEVGHTYIERSDFINAFVEIK